MGTDFDVKMDEGTVWDGLMKGLQAVIGDHWCWIGDNYFPEIYGAWFTVTWNLPADFTGDYEIGLKPNGFYGTTMVAGVGIDNFRLEPKE